MPILTGNIFGVDLDEKAIDFARLNLLLRGLAKRDHLPPLTDNIKQGNSLISGTEKELKGYFGKDWKDKHPFIWEDEFKDVMAGGGFDVVVGNPPYVGFQGFNEDKNFLRDHYKSCSGRFDVYLPFIENGMKLLKTGGILGFICPSNFMKRQYGQNLRELSNSTMESYKSLTFRICRYLKEY
jgi:methylase of polypeptide subunit release factors